MSKEQIEKEIKEAEDILRTEEGIAFDRHGCEKKIEELKSKIGKKK